MNYCVTYELEVLLSRIYTGMPHEPVVQSLCTWQPRKTVEERTCFRIVVAALHFFYSLVPTCNSHM